LLCKKPPEVITLSKEDYKKFKEVVDHPPEPTQKLKDLLKMSECSDKEILESFDKGRKPDEEIDRENSSVEIKGRTYNV